MAGRHVRTMKRTPQQFENDFFVGWDEAKKHASAATLKWQDRFIAEKKRLIARWRRRKNGGANTKSR